MLLCWWGGAFKVFGLPQIILVINAVFGLLSGTISFGKISRSDFFSATASLVMMFGILCWAGFFGSMA